MNSSTKNDITEHAFLNISQIDMVFPTATGGFTALKDVDLKIDKAALNDYFGLTYFTEERSVYKDLRKLEPGTYLSFDGEKVIAQNFKENAIPD